MAQSDYELAAHVSGLNQRTEINSIFDSILTHNSGSTAPTVTKAFMMWVDTSNATYYYLKMRNHDNTAWVTLGIYTVATKAYTSYAEGTVKLTENQIIDGVKTFSSSPIVPTPTTGTQAVNKDYADLKVALTQFIGANQSKLQNGYQKLPGGLIVQWGTDPGGGNDRNISYPIAFPNAVFGVHATMGHGHIATSEVQGVGTGNYMYLTFFTVFPRYQDTSGGSGVAIQPIQWFAIGY